MEEKIKGNVTAEGTTLTPAKIEPGPLVSIIVPVYKLETFLPQCLDSILGQTLKEIELICVDDGSFGNLPKILATYAADDTRVKIITQANSGISQARNAGLAAATAPYVGFVDYDDWIEAQTYERAVSLMESAPDIDLVGWRTNIYDNTKGPFHQKGRFRSKGEGAPFLLNDNTMGELNYCVWNKLFKTEIIRQNKLAFINAHAEDYIFLWDYLPHARRAFFTAQSFYNHRRHGQSVSGRLQDSDPSESITYGANITAQKGFAEITMWEKILSTYHAQGYLDRYKNALTKAILISLSGAYNKAKEKAPFLDALERLAQNYNLPPKISSCITKSRQNGYFCFKERKWFERIFSIKNAGPKKLIYLLGFEFTINRQQGKEL